MILFGKQRRPSHMHRHGFFARRQQPRIETQADGETSLVGIGTGDRAIVTGFLPGLSDERKSHLQAYGLVEGYPVQIIQHSPVTVVRIEHFELALERDLARQVRVRRTR